MKLRLLALAGLCCAFFSSCAVEEETLANEDEKMFLEAWIHTHHPDAEKKGMGIYILNEEPVGTGEDVTMPCYVLVTYTVRDTDGNITSSSDAESAKQTGDYDRTYYYGPSVWSFSEGTINKGLEDLLTGMKVGGEREALIPGWLQTYKRYDTEEEYMKEVTDQSALIYKVRVDGITEDIYDWQTGQIEKYCAEHSLTLPEADPDGFYYITETAGEGKTEDMHKDTTVYINYTGMRMDGQVFDTTDERTAKDHHIFSESKTYEPMAVKMSSDSTQIKLDGNSIISGFGKTLWEMKPMEKGIGIFHSTYGYGTSGSGSLIPAYAPLVFKIELVPDPDPDEEETEDEETEGEEDAE